MQWDTQYQTFLSAGGKAFPFNPIWPWRRKGPFLFRDHRKLLVVDEAEAYCGSLNIGMDYAGKSIGGKGRFRDTVAKLEGPCVVSFREMFLSSMQETIGVVYPYEPSPQRYTKGSYVQVLASNAHRNLAAIQKSMAVTLNQATHFCFLTSPYFLPYPSLKKALMDAVLRGVDVRILTAGLSDVPLMRLASQHVYGQLLQAGVRIYEMFEKTLHAKTATIDGVYCSVGSYNLDHWSARRNLELNVAIWDKKVAHDLERQFYKDLQFSREVTWEKWTKRALSLKALQWASYQIMRL